MKTYLISLLFSLVFIVGCSTTPQQKVEDQNERVISHLEKGKRVIGKDFDEKFLRDGLINGEYVAVGSFVSNDQFTNNMNHLLRAGEDARSKMITSAPTEIKKVVQSAISTLSGTNEAEQIQISVSEVQALTGMSSGINDSQCVKFAEPTQDMKYRYSTECRVLVRVPASNLMKAYNYTLDKKYSVKEESQIKEIMKQQLMDKVLDKPAIVKVTPQVTSNQ